jgi:CRP/FNR family cyclic AMP-dependent transcriptional regulator
VIPDEILKMIQTYRVLRELEPEQLRKLLTIAEDKEFDAGQVIFREGDKSFFFYLIVSGEVDLEDVSGGRPVRVQTLEAGDAMGWSSLTADAHTHFQSRALSPVSAIAFPGARIREACDRDPAMGYALTRRLLDLVTERLDATRMRLASGHATLQSTQAH